MVLPITYSTVLFIHSIGYVATCDCFIASNSNQQNLYINIMDTCFICVDFFASSSSSFDNLSHTRVYLILIKWCIACSTRLVQTMELPCYLKKYLERKVWSNRQIAAEKNQLKRATIDCCSREMRTSKSGIYTTDFQVGG